MDESEQKEQPSGVLTEDATFSVKHPGRKVMI